MLKLKKETALNLSLEGSVGSFNVGTGRPGQNSLEVKYFLTHVGLDFGAGTNEAVLSHIAPVRETFDFEQLDFDEIMQRDIDDSRVSGELIPYLLDAKSADLVKLFPPIIITVLPVLEGQKRPASLYPRVEEEDQAAIDEDSHPRRLTRAGAVGSEVFEFDQPLIDNKPIKHDLVRFRLNTHRTRLVIVDGQHRAMALLALYRNIKDEWSDEKRSPFKEYYAEWTRNYIQQFNLKEINLPVMFCTFPQLCEGYSGGFDLKKASRAVFLTLNKTARKVSNSRNILLDDSDFVALLLRRCLSEIKGRDARSPYSLRIFNVELDQFEDRLRIQSPIAVTGVSHVYYLLEHLLLNQGDEDVNGTKPRAGKFYKRTDLNTYGAMDRLGGRDLLGADAADSTRRDIFTSEAAEQLAKRFMERFGGRLAAIFERFAPYEIHARAVLEMEARLEAHEDRKLRPILFEGQGIGRVFHAHRENLRVRLKEGAFETDVPKIEALLAQLDGTATRIDSALDQFRQDRVARYLDGVTDKGKVRRDGAYPDELVGLFDGWYDNVFTTVAFQAALFCGFYGEIERYTLQCKAEEKTTPDLGPVFDEYLEQLNTFFIPQSSSQLKRLIRLFEGEVDGDVGDMKIARSAQTFRAVVFRGEMQPDQWPKYKYLLLEIWRPSNTDLARSLEGERRKCRRQVFAQLYDAYRADYAEKQMKREDDLDTTERKQIFDEAYGAYEGFLRVVGIAAADMPGKRELREVPDGVPPSQEL